MRFYLIETVFKSDDLIVKGLLRYMSYCFLKEKNLCLDTSYKTRDVVIRSSYYYSVGCLWHSHGKNPVRLYPKLQS